VALLFLLEGLLSPLEDPLDLLEALLYLLWEVLPSLVALCPCPSCSQMNNY